MSKKISVDTVRTYLKEAKPSGTAEAHLRLEDGKDVIVTIRTHLSTAEKSAFIARVLIGCFDERGEYRPEYFTPMLRATILQMCTDLPALSVRAKDGGESQLDLDAMDALYVALNLDGFSGGGYREMMSELVFLAQSAVEWRKARELNGSGKSVSAAADAARELLNALTEKVSEIDAEAMMDYAAKLAKAAEGTEPDALRDAVVKAGLKLVK